MTANEGIFAATHFKRKRLVMVSSTKVRSGRAARDFAERDVMMQCVLTLSLLLCLGGVGCSAVPPDRDSDSFAVLPIDFIPSDSFEGVVDDYIDSDEAVRRYSDNELEERALQLADRMITEKVRVDPGWAKAASDAEGFSVVGPIREYSVTEEGVERIPGGLFLVKADDELIGLISLLSSSLVVGQNGRWIDSSQDLDNGFQNVLLSRPCALIGKDGARYLFVKGADEADGDAPFTAEEIQVISEEIVFSNPVDSMPFIPNLT